MTAIALYDHAARVPLTISPYHRGGGPSCSTLYFVEIAAMRSSSSGVGMCGGGRVNELAGSPSSMKPCSMPAGVVSCSSRAGVSPYDAKGVRHVPGQVDERA